MNTLFVMSSLKDNITDTVEAPGITSWPHFPLPFFPVLLKKILFN